METVVCYDQELTFTLMVSIFDHLIRKAKRNRERFVTVSMAQLVKLTDCWDERFIDAAVARLITSGVIQPTKQGDRGGFIVRRPAQSRCSQQPLTEFDVQFLKRCGVAASAAS